MSEPPTPEAVADKSSAADVNGQLIAALTTLIILGIIGIGLVVVGWALRDFKEVGIPLGVVVGALANSLTSPTGIGNVIRAGISAKTAAIH